MPLTTYTAGEVLTAASLNANFSFAASSGAVVQVKSTTKTDAFTMSSTTFADVTGLSVSITPTSASNKIFVTVTMMTSNGANTLYARLRRGSTDIGVGDTAGSRTRVTGANFSADATSADQIAMSFLDTPNTTSATTYSVQIAGAGDLTMSVNAAATDTDVASRPRGISTITVFEVTP